MLGDDLQRFLFDNTDIRGAIVTLERSFADLIAGKDFTATERGLMAEFAAANILLTGNLKFEGSLTLQARAPGPISLIASECNEKLEFRAILEASGSQVDMDFTDTFADATLAITVEPAQGARYQGIVSLEKNSLAACLEEYFKQSEQLPTWFRFVEAEGCVRGIMLQALPAQVCVDDEQRLEDWQRIQHLASTLKPQEMTTLSNDELLHRLYHEETVRLFDKDSVTYRCHCSEERMERALLSLGEAQLKEIIVEDGKIDTQCHFCHKEYHFNEGQILQLLQGHSGSSSH